MVIALVVRLEGGRLMNGDPINCAYLVLSACTFLIVGIMERATVIVTTLSGTCLASSCAITIQGT